MEAVLGGKAAVLGDAVFREAPGQTGRFQLADEGTAQRVLLQNERLVDLPEPVHRLLDAGLVLEGLLRGQLVRLFRRAGALRLGKLVFQLLELLFHLSVLLHQPLQGLDGGDGLLLMLLTLLLEDLVLAAFHCEGVQQQQERRGEQDRDILEDGTLTASLLAP